MAAEQGFDAQTIEAHVQSLCEEHGIQVTKTEEWWSGKAIRPERLLVGAFAADGRLRYLGPTVALTAQVRRQAGALLAESVAPSSLSGWPMPGRSRWESRRFDEWTPVEPAVVCEVVYGRLDSSGLRHGCRFVRWRPERSAQSCRLGPLLPAQITLEQAAR